MNFETEQYIGNLIVRYIQGTLTVSEKNELTEWRKISPKHEEIFLRMTSYEYLDKNIRLFIKSQDEREKEWRIIRKKTLGRKHVYIKQWLRYSAILALLVSMSTISYLKIKNRTSESTPVSITRHEGYPILVLPNGEQVDLGKEEATSILKHNALTLIQNDSLSGGQEVGNDSIIKYHTLKIPKGAEHILILNDSSVIYLNSETELIFPLHFPEYERKVYLVKGEAYFDIKKEGNRPFIVEISSLKIEVLGTTFCIRAYDNEETIQTILESGKVEVKANYSNVILAPSTQALFNKTTKTLETTPVDLEQALAWRYGRLVFDNCPLKNILRDLARWYAFDVVYTQDNIADLPFSLNIKKHESFYQILNLIEATEKVTFEIEGNTVIVK